MEKMLIRVLVLQYIIVFFCESAFSFLFSGFWSVPTELDSIHHTEQYLRYLYCYEVCCPSFATISTKMAPISCE